AYFPPGTIKGNKIGPRLFSFSASNWRGEPLRGYETIVNLIAKTTTAKGLTVTCRLDRRKYPTGRKVTAKDMKKVNLYPDTFHGERNYVIKTHPIPLTPGLYNFIYLLSLRTAIPHSRRCGM